MATPGRRSRKNNWRLKPWCQGLRANRQRLARAAKLGLDVAKETTDLKKLGISLFNEGVNLYLAARFPWPSNGCGRRGNAPAAGGVAAKSRKKMRELNLDDSP